MGFSARILTLYPELFPGPLAYSLAGKALKAGLWSLDVINIRDFAHGKHRLVDSPPYGGGPGMVMRPDVLGSALDSLAQPSKIIFLSPRGRVFRQQDAQDLAKLPHITLLCGHFAGIDQRIVETYPICEISIGDYILSGGEMAAFIVLDAIIRLLPNVIGNADSLKEESFEDNLLAPHAYTKPRIFKGLKVPDILLSGHHANIRDFKERERRAFTKERRPDLYERYLHEQENIAPKPK